MKAIVIADAGAGPELRLVENPAADSPADQVCIDVEVAGVTFPDVLTIAGTYQHQRQLPFVPGVEAVGVVRSAPAGSGLESGQRVIAMTPEGGWQQQVSAPVETVFPVPDGMGPAQASSVLVNYVAAHFGLVTRGGAVSGETLVVHGAAGGLGSAAVELAGALGLTVIGIVSTPEKADFVRGLGADHVVLTDNWRDTVTKLVGQRRVDLVFDPVGGDRVIESLRVLAPGGRHLVMGFTAGEIPEIKINRLLLGNISLVGVATGQYMSRHPGELQRQWAAVVELIAARRGRVSAATTFPVDAYADAIATVRERRAIGRVAIDFRA